MDLPVARQRTTASRGREADVSGIVVDRQFRSRPVDGERAAGVDDIRRPQDQRAPAVQRDAPDSDRSARSAAVERAGGGAADRESIRAERVAVEAKGGAVV